MPTGLEDFAAFSVSGPPPHYFKLLLPQVAVCDVCFFSYATCMSQVKSGEILHGRFWSFWGLPKHTAVHFRLMQPESDPGLDEGDDGGTANVAIANVKTPCRSAHRGRARAILFFRSSGVGYASSR